MGLLKQTHKFVGRLSVYKTTSLDREGLYAAIWIDIS